MALDERLMSKPALRLGPAVQDGCGPLIENARVGMKAGRRLRLERDFWQAQASALQRSASFKLAGTSWLALGMPAEASAQPMSAWDPLVNVSAHD